MGSLLAAIVFVDLVGSTRLRMEHGDDAAEQVRRRFEYAVRTVSEHHGGHVVKFLGDGAMAVAPTARAALAASRDIRGAIARGSRQGGPVLASRVGVAVGDVIEEDGDYHGRAVVEAARLCDAAGTDQIALTDLVRRLADLGDDELDGPRSVELKGFDAPCDIWIVSDDRNADRLGSPRLLALETSRPLIGRRDERAALRRAADRARTGAAAVTAILGEPGVGKTRLAADAAEEWSADGIVLFGRADELRASPFGPFAQAVADFATTAPPDLLGSLAPRTRQLARLVPELADDTSHTVPSGAPLDRRVVTDAIIGWVRDLVALSPVMIVIDDVQWCDDLSLAVIPELVAGRATGPLTVVLTARDTDVLPAPVQQLVDRSSRTAADVSILRVEGLAHDDVIDLVRARIASTAPIPPPTVQRLHAATEGNPLYLLQLIEDVSPDGDVSAQIDLAIDRAADAPGAVNAVAARLARLDLDASRMLTTAAAIGQHFEIELLASQVEGGRALLVDRLDRLEGAHLIRSVDATSYTFSHGLVHSELIARQSAAAAAHRNAELADAVDERPWLHDQVDRLARHWQRAGDLADPTRAVEAYRAAARRSLEQTAFGNAADWLELALGASERLRNPSLECRIQVDLGLAMRLAGRRGARRQLLAAGERARELDETQTLIDAVLFNNRGWGSMIGQLDLDKIRLIEEAIELADDGDVRLPLLLAVLADELAYSDPLDRRGSLSSRAVALARDGGSDTKTLFEVLIRRARLLLRPEQIHERAQITSEVVALADELGDDRHRIEAINVRLQSLQEVPDFATCRTLLDEWHGIDGALDSDPIRWSLHSADSYHQLLHGDLDAAERSIHSAMRLAVKLGHPDAHLMAGAIDTNLRYLRDRLADVVPAIRAALGTLGPDPSWVARHLLLAGEADEAYDLWLQATEGDLSADMGGSYLVSHGVLAAEFGPTRIAEQTYERMLPLAPHTFGLLVPDLPNHLVLGMLAGSLGRYEAATMHFDDARRLARESDAPIWSITTELEAAKLRRAHALPGDDEMLHRARARAEHIGAHRLVRDADTLIEGSVNSS